MSKALVLSSGGVDSTTCLALAIEAHGKENVSTLSIFYGQRHEKELECARKLAEYYQVPHFEKDISTIMDMSNCSLLSSSTQQISEEDYLKQIKKSSFGMVSSYVPFRNGLFLSCAAALALSIYPNEYVDLYYGAHADDSAGAAYADCSPEFSNAINEAIYLGSYKLIKVLSPLISMNKAQVVKLGTTLNVPYELTWSCYKGEEKACGKCGTCLDRLQAFTKNGLVDPISYYEV